MALLCILLLLGVAPLHRDNGLERSDQPANLIAYLLFCNIVYCTSGISE